MKNVIFDASTGTTIYEDAPDVIAAPESAPVLTDAERLAALEETAGQIIGILAGIEGVTL